MPVPGGYREAACSLASAEIVRVIPIGVRPSEG